MKERNEPREIIERCLRAIETGEIAKMFDCMDDAIEWINVHPVMGVNDILPWIGIFYGKEDVEKSYIVFKDAVKIRFLSLIDIVKEGDQAIAMIKEGGTCKATGRNYDMDYAVWIKIRDSKIVWWKTYIDPSRIIAAFKK